MSSKTPIYNLPASYKFASRKVLTAYVVFYLSRSQIFGTSSEVTKRSLFRLDLKHGYYKIKGNYIEKCILPISLGINFNPLLIRRKFFP
jgi:hypothetical protein